MSKKAMVYVGVAVVVVLVFVWWRRSKMAAPTGGAATGPASVNGLPDNAG